MSKEEKKAIKENKKRTRYEKFTNFNKTRIITWLSYLLIIAVIVLSSALQMIFDIENFDWIRFATNLCFSLSIAILSMILSMKDGEITNESKKTGDYAETKKTFGECLKKIIDRDVFRQFCDIIYIRERKSYIESNLASVSVFNSNYMNISDDDLKTLRKEPKMCVIGKNDDNSEIKKPLDIISDLQYYTIKKYRDGHFKFPKIEYTFFISRNSKNSYKYQASLQQKQKNTKVLSILYRCLLITIISAIFALAVVNPNDGSGKQIAFDVVSRMFTLITSVFFGYMISYDEMKQNIDALQYKIDIINQYDVERSTGSFKPIDVEEQVLRKIEKIEAERRAKEEEYRANVIQPEIVKEVVENQENKYVEIEMSEEEYQDYINK